MSIKENIARAKEKIENVSTFYEGNEYLQSLVNSEDLYHMFSEWGGNILISIKENYPLWVETLREVRKFSGKLGALSNWYSTGKMLFKYENALIEVRFQCDPDKVPEELLPSKTCRVEKHTIPESEEYSIICEISE